MKDGTLYQMLLEEWSKYDKKIKLVTFLKITGILFTIILLALFVYKCTFVISWKSHISFFDMVFKTDSFLEYSFLDSALKLNLLFAVCLFIVLLLLKFKKTDKIAKFGFVATVVVLVLTIIINVGSILGYEYAAQNEIWKVSSTYDKDFQPVPSEYSKYFPHFGTIDEITDKAVSYEYSDVRTLLGRYAYMESWCYDLEVSFSFEEIQTKSPWLLSQFVFTKGTPNYINDDYKTVYIEAVKSEEYGCIIYKQDDIYEICYEGKDTYTILRYEGFEKILNYTEADILKDSKNIYDSLCRE